MKAKWLGATGINPVYGLLTNGEEYEFSEPDFEKFKSQNLVETIKPKTKKEK